MVAVQGPKAAQAMLEIVDNVVEAPEASGAGETVAEAIEGLGYYAAFQGIAAGQPVLVARTGYTGEDGFELIVDNDGAEAVWTKAMDVAGQLGGLPCGLACRGRGVPQVHPGARLSARFPERHRSDQPRHAPRRGLERA